MSRAKRTLRSGHRGAVERMDAALAAQLRTLDRLIRREWAGTGHVAAVNRRTPPEKPGATGAIACRLPGMISRRPDIPARTPPVHLSVCAMAVSAGIVPASRRAFPGNWAFIHECAPGSESSPARIRTGHSGSRARTTSISGATAIIPGLPGMIPGGTGMIPVPAGMIASAPGMIPAGSGMNPGAA